MPNSLVWIGLVALSLFVLVPTLVSTREPVRRPSEHTFATRLLHRGGGRKLNRTPTAGAGHRTEADWEPEAEEPSTAEPEQKLPHNPHLYLIHGEDRMDAHDDYENDGPDTDGRVSGSREEGGYDAETIARRRGRGGFDPQADELAASARYTFRQRVVLALAVLLVVAAIVALVLQPIAWVGVIVLGVTLVGYLGYLRTQVRIEREIRERRLARLRGERAPRTDEIAEEGRNRGASGTLEYDDESPEFEEFDDYYDDRESGLPRASGQ
jgi:hypothetical protein